MTNEQVAIAFSVNRSGHSLNMFSEGHTVYSYGYHFPIAKHTGKEYRGKEIIIFNSRGYSVTTARHKSHVKWAIAGSYIIELSNCDIKNGQEELLKRLVEYGKKSIRARKEVNREYYKQLVWDTDEQLKVLKEYF